ncbi:hypothetical protein DB346_00115 [Verrucomicrobia bacterium LW23]|nr:hypothetical protein DB346_00115 [Verrucomicrobia bacterium LW23]
MFLIRYVTILAKSFFSRDLYNEVVWKWRGSGFLFLLPLCALSWVPLTLQIVRSTDQVMADNVPVLVKHWPPGMVLRQGSLIAPEPGPFLINLPGAASIPLPDLAATPDPRQGEATPLLLVIDPQGKADAALKSKADIILGEKEIRFQTDDSSSTVPLTSVEQIFTALYPSKGDVTLKAERVEQTAYWFGNTLKIIVYPLGSVLYYFGEVFRALLLSILAVLTNNVLQRGLYYQPLLRITVLAMTPAILLNIALQLGIIAVGLPMWWMRVAGAVTGAVALGYIIFGVQAIALPPELAPDHSNDDDDNNDDEEAGDEAEAHGAARLP